MFDKWEQARQDAILAQKRSDEAFKALARFVQQHHGDALEPFFELVTDWSSDQGGSDAEAQAVRAMVLASAVPVEPFKKLEDEALAALQNERNGVDAD
jgi:hypothetical protein